MRIYNSYNLPYLAKPGDDLFAAARLENLSQAKAELYDRLQKGEDQDVVIRDLQQKFEVSTGKPQHSRLMACHC